MDLEIESYGGLLCFLGGFLMAQGVPKGKLFWISVGLLFFELQIDYQAGAM